MIQSLKPLDPSFRRPGPVVAVILDGIGIGKADEGNAIYRAKTPVLDRLCHSPLYAEIYAHGTFVGMPNNSDMGNSEVGHNAMGAGRIFPQGAKLVNSSLDTGDLFKGETWRELIENCLRRGTPLHFMGLLSDGNVHSHISHLKALAQKAHEQGVKILRLHAILDGRDVGPRTAHLYVREIESFFTSLNSKGCDARIASGGGRQEITMDRYKSNWSIVEKGWATHVEAKARCFSSAPKAIETLRRETGKIDQYLPPFVIADKDVPIGRIEDGHSVIFFNFRGDRAIEITRAFEEKTLPDIRREIFPDVIFAGMMEYDGDLHIPGKYLVSSPKIDGVMGEYLIATGIRQFALSESQKYGHVTYFWNGNRSGKFSKDLEDYFEIPSDRVPLEKKPEMKASEIAEKTIFLIESGRYGTGRINFANGDMVGHTGDFEASIAAVEAVDRALGRILKALEKCEGIGLIVADHGNCEEMFQKDPETGKIKRDSHGHPSPKTSHTLNRVPLSIYDPAYCEEYDLVVNDRSGLGNIAATIFNLLGYAAPEGYLPSLIRFK